MLVLALQIALFAHLVWLGFHLLSRSRFQSLPSSLGIQTLLLAGFIGFIVVSDEARPDWDAAKGMAAATFVLTGAMVWTFGRIVGQNRGERERRSSAALLELVGIVAGVLGGVAGAAIFVFAPDTVSVTPAVQFVVGVAFIAAGVSVTRIESNASGESYLLDLGKSYDYSFLIAAIFGGQVVLAMWTGTGVTGTMLALLLGTITAAIAIQVFLDRVQLLLDQIAFANTAWLREERAQLRRVENILPRVNMTDPLTIPEDEFSKLTRRALSNYGDLTKLATSPLTNLPEVHRRLAARELEPSTLERARELKVLLAESIERLRPRTDGAVGTTDEWRYYNALYFPYIVGMRPYSSTAVHNFDEPAQREVLDWFQVYVPERTLYNWQNAAAALIAGHLREQEEIAVSPNVASSREFTAAS